MVLKNKIVHPILTIIIPTFNEVNNISKIVEKLESALSTVKYKIIFVDDESNDGTINKIRLLEAQKSNISLLLKNWKTWTIRSLHRRYAYFKN